MAVYYGIVIIIPYMGQFVSIFSFYRKCATCNFIQLYSRCVWFVTLFMLCNICIIQGVGQYKKMSCDTFSKKRVGKKLAGDVFVGR